MQASKMKHYARILATTTAIVLMVAVPMTALDEQRPSRFGWHMYAGNINPPAIRIETESGDAEDRDLMEFVARYRPELDYFEPAARHLCESEPNIVAVRVERDFPMRSEDFKCANF